MSAVPNIASFKLYVSIEFKKPSEATSHFFYVDRRKSFETQPGFQSIFLFAGDIFVLVFAMDSRESFEEVMRLRDQILETKASASSGTSRGRRQAPRVPMAIAGNKCDRELK